mgnify:CR=1 FL=1
MFGMTTQTQYTNSDKVATVLTEEDIFNFVDKIIYVKPDTKDKE